jgi:hypothetical protein
VFGFNITTPPPAGGGQVDTIATRLNNLETFRTNAESRICDIENLTNEYDENGSDEGNDRSIIVTQLTQEKDSSNSLTILGRIKSLEENITGKPGDTNKSINYRVGQLETQVSDINK